MSALEALSWHEDKAEASDETIRAQRSKFDLVEKRPAPLSLNDKEILDFADEYADVIQQVPATEIYRRRFVIKIDGMDIVRAESLREAVCLAAAKFKEVNCE